jgi:hypothetical protein
MTAAQSHLIQILLPLRDNEGRNFPDSLFADIQKILTDRYGGVTAYARAPAQGVWARDGAKMRDDIVMLEVMTPELDAAWWKSFRQRLEKIMRQEQVVIRSQSITIL